jgi:hypothetical protein
MPEARLREIEIVRDLYLPEAFLFHAAPHVKVPSGCWNILNAIKSSSRCSQNVYLVEEDVLVYPNFFSRHESTLKSCESSGQLNKVAASCGRMHPDPRWQYRHLYTNPGSCLTRPLLDALVPHINAEYFQDTKAYCEKYFEPWDVSTLDDWLIRRVMRQEGMTAAYGPAVCAHVGFRNYNVLDIYQNKEGSLEERIAKARHLLATTSPSDRYARDFEPYLPTESS